MLFTGGPDLEKDDIPHMRRRKYWIGAAFEWFRGNHSCTAPTWNGDLNFSKWGPNGDLILSEMGTKWGPSATEMGTKGPNGD